MAGRWRVEDVHHPRMQIISARRQRFLLSALLAATVLVVYAPLTGYDFIALDDAGYVRANENLNGGFSWAGLAWILKNPVGGNWHPVTMLSHMADCQLYGLYAGGHHLTNVLLHLANTLLLFWTLLALFERWADPIDVSLCYPN